MSVSVSEEGPDVNIGNPCPVNGKATVSIEIVMTAEQRMEMIKRLATGKALLGDRREAIEALGLASVEEE